MSTVCVRMCFTIVCFASLLGKCRTSRIFFNVKVLIVLSRSQAWHMGKHMASDMRSDLLGLLRPLAMVASDAKTLSRWKEVNSKFQCLAKTDMWELL